jgi:fatty acid desaturase
MSNLISSVPRVIQEPLHSVPSELMHLVPWRWLADVVLDWSLIVAVFVGFYWLDTPVWLVPFAAFLIGSRQHALAVLGHEGAHFLIVRSRTVNDLLSQSLVSWPLLICIEHGYRPWHFDHHRDLGTEDDPELSYRLAPVYQGQVTWWRIGLLFCGDILGLGSLNGIRFLKVIFPSKHKSAFIIPAVIWILAIVGFTLSGLWWVPALWAWSMFSGFFAIFRVRTFTEHVGVPPAGKETSHRFCPGVIVRFFFLPHNTWCHYEHHKWPQVPYYYLPRLREIDPSKPIVSFAKLFPL